MCGRIDTSGLTWAEIHDQLSAFADYTGPAPNLQTTPDARPTTDQLTARLSPEGWVLEKMRWWLVPHWRSGKPLKDTAKGAGDGFKLTTFNARTETVATAPTFRDAYAKRRCVVPATAWYEWTGAVGHKVKHRFTRADGAPVWFAGIWDRCSTPDAGDISSFAILTVPSSGWLAGVHSRAPVVLEQADWVEWLSGAAPNLEVRSDRFIEPT
jgi:putative SOS response-associated peptidase YedK